MYININGPRGGFRSPIQQQQLLDEWYAGERLAKKPASVGGSYHQTGMAIDFNPYFENGGNLHSTNNSKQEWINSGIVAIAKSLSLRWGGDFASPGNPGYDPVHVDFGRIVSKQTFRRMLALSRSRNIEPTQITVDEARIDAIQSANPGTLVTPGGSTPTAY